MLPCIFSQWEKMGYGVFTIEHILEKRVITINFSNNDQCNLLSLVMPMHTQKCAKKKYGHVRWCQIWGLHLGLIIQTSLYQS